jgi:hypothetical protein
MSDYKNPNPGEEIEFDPSITEDQIQIECYEEVPAKYEEIRGMVRQYLTWKKRFGSGEFIENTAENEALVQAKYEDNQIWSLFRYDVCHVSPGFYPNDSVEGWYISDLVADKVYADVLFELTIDCPVCDQTGEVDDEECTECEGQGNIWFRVDY